MASRTEVVYNTIIPPGLTPFLTQLHHAGFTRCGGTIVCTYFDENFLNLVPAEQVEGLYGCLDYYRDVDDPFSIELLNRYEARTPGAPCSRRGAHALVPTGLSSFGRSPSPKPARSTRTM